MARLPRIVLPAIPHQPPPWLVDGRRSARIAGALGRRVPWGKLRKAMGCRRCWLPSNG